MSKSTGRRSRMYDGTATEKPCTLCKQTKPLTSFYKQKDRSTRGWHWVSWCNTCHNLPRWPLNRALRIKRQEELAGRPKPTQCEVCGQSERKICWDHDHNSGTFRGWLCDRCNSVLGMTKDNPYLLRFLAYYLDKINGFPRFTIKKAK